MFGKKKHHHSEEAAEVNVANGVDASKATEASAPDCHQEHTHSNVAVPEIRTGKVDVAGDFERAQHTDTELCVEMDNLAVPEVHTGKCGPIDNSEKPRHTHGLLRTLMDGTTED